MVQQLAEHVVVQVQYLLRQLPCLKKSRCGSWRPLRWSESCAVVAGTAIHRARICGHCCFEFGAIGWGLAACKIPRVLCLSIAMLGWAASQLERATL